MASAPHTQIFPGVYFIFFGLQQCQRETLREAVAQCVTKAWRSKGEITTAIFISTYFPCMYCKVNISLPCTLLIDPFITIVCVCLDWFSFSLSSHSTVTFYFTFSRYKMVFVTNFSDLCSQLCHYHSISTKKKKFNTECTYIKWVAYTYISCRWGKVDQ